MTQFWIGTSWKMNKTLAEACDFAEGLIASDTSRDPRIQRFVIPPFTAVRDVKGNLGDKAALRKAIAAAKFDSVRGSFKFNTNGYPIQDYYLRVITKDAQGRITNRTLGTVFKNHADAYVGQCKMPAL